MPAGQPVTILQRPRAQRCGRTGNSKPTLLPSEWPCGMRDACRQTQTWRARMLDSPIAIAVNVSRRQLSDSDFVNDVADTLVQTGIDPATVTLEITESALAADPDPNASDSTNSETSASESRSMTSAPGTRRSQLCENSPSTFSRSTKPSMLRRPHPRTQQREPRQRHRAVRRQPRPRPRTVAEGVEHPQQLHRLRELGCHQYQGAPPPQTTIPRQDPRIPRNSITPRRSRA
jgi:predicted signal transduction protein with EAL and GGDEF domain